MLGQAKRIEVGKENTIIIDGAGNETNIKARIDTNQKTSGRIIKRLRP